MSCTGCGRCCKEFIFELGGDKEWVKQFTKFLEVTRSDYCEGLPNGLKLKVPCKYLNKENKCTIYTDRPDICRNFYCKKAKE